MPKLLTHIVAFLLVPCLAGDPVLASAQNNPLSTLGGRGPASLGVRGDIFTQEALSAPLELMQHARDIAAYRIRQGVGIYRRSIWTGQEGKFGSKRRYPKKGTAAAPELSKGRSGGTLTLPTTYNEGVRYYYANPKVLRNDVAWLYNPNHGNQRSVIEDLANIIQHMNEGMDSATALKEAKLQRSIEVRYAPEKEKPYFLNLDDPGMMDQLLETHKNLNEYQKEVRKACISFIAGAVEIARTLWEKELLEKESTNLLLEVVTEFVHNYVPQHTNVRDDVIRAALHVTVQGIETLSPNELLGGVAYWSHLLCNAVFPEASLTFKNPETRKQKLHGIGEALPAAAPENTHHTPLPEWKGRLFESALKGYGNIFSAAENVVDERPAMGRLNPDGHVPGRPQAYQHQFTLRAYAIMMCLADRKDLYYLSDYLQPLVLKTELHEYIEYLLQPLVLKKIITKDQAHWVAQRVEDSREKGWLNDSDEFEQRKGDQVLAQLRQETDFEVRKIVEEIDAFIRDPELHPPDNFYMAADESTSTEAETGLMNALREYRSETFNEELETHPTESVQSEPSGVPALHVVPARPNTSGQELMTPTGLLKVGETYSRWKLPQLMNQRERILDGLTSNTPLSEYPSFKLQAHYAHLETFLSGSRPAVPGHADGTELVLFQGVEPIKPSKSKPLLWILMIFDTQRIWLGSVSLEQKGPLFLIPPHDVLETDDAGPFRNSKVSRRFYELLPQAIAVLVAQGYIVTWRHPKDWIEEFRTEEVSVYDRIRSDQRFTVTTEQEADDRTYKVVRLAPRGRAARLGLKPAGDNQPKLRLAWEKPKRGSVLLSMPVILLTATTLLGLLVTMPHDSVHNLHALGQIIRTALSLALAMLGWLNRKHIENTIHNFILLRAA